MNLINKVEPVQVNKEVINWAIGLVLARCILLVIFQGILAFYYHLQGNQTPWESAAKWWTVYGNLADISCLLLLAFALKKEGKDLSSLIDFDKKKIFQDLKSGLLIFFLIFPLIGLLYTFVTGYLILNENTLNLTINQLGERTLPSWAYYYSIFIWWTIWSMTEELTYQSYSLRRLIGEYGQVKTLIFVGFFFALQHSFLPLIFDWRYILWRLVAFFPLVVCLMIAYMKTGRITPVIIAHALMDINAAYWTFKY
jgi:membrane protease YdiL (CAAX protease family)